MDLPTAEAEVKKLRDQAAVCLNARNRLKQESQDALKGGERTRALQLGEEAKQESEKYTQLMLKAGHLLFEARNASSPPGTMDVRGLQVMEAHKILDEQLASYNGPQKLIVVTGADILRSSVMGYFQRKSKSPRTATEADGPAYKNGNAVVVMM